MLNLRKIAKQALCLLVFGTGLTWGGTVRDSRTGRVYQTVRIGNQTWFAQDLDDSRKVNWNELGNACPEGWRVPSWGDWKEFLKVVGTDEAAAKDIKARSGWPSDVYKRKIDNNGSDRYGLAMRPVRSNKKLCSSDLLGEEDCSSFKYVDDTDIYVGYWSSSSPIENHSMNFLLMDKPGISTSEITSEIQVLDWRVRCIQGSFAAPDPIAQRLVSTAQIKDPRDGKVYPTVRIGSKRWITRNLSYDVQGSICKDKQERNCNSEGRLYTRTAASQACPQGWRLSTRQDWLDLMDALGEGDTKLVAYRLTQRRRWKAVDGQGDPDLGLLPVGASEASWWSEYSEKPLNHWKIDESGRLGNYSYYKDENRRLSVRCIEE
jgi:uncharacterized protein (TIGR02145 family)